MSLLRASGAAENHERQVVVCGMGGLHHLAAILPATLLAALCHGCVQGRGETMQKLRKQARLRPALKGMGLICFAGYLTWNAHWLAQRRLPPSILVAVTGLPCPTTGMTRSIMSLISGDLSNSIRYNVFTIPIVLLMMYSALALLRALLSGQSVALSPLVARLWGFVLAAAWLSKFLL
jgi:hypothetical protein